ncbi:hypothetical protein K439DRAFT_732358 [Ramaria rubella]|nr:hypothetical protein K439DRAFT_732358 [Ramaria rubella]
MHLEQRNSEPASHSQLRRPEDSELSEQRPSVGIAHPEQQSRRLESNMSQPVPVAASLAVEQRRPEPATTPYPTHPHDRDGVHFHTPSLPQPAPGNGPPNPHRAEQHSSSSADDHTGLRSVSSDQRVLSGMSTLRSGPPSPEMNRRPDSATDRTAGRPSIGGSLDNNAPRPPADRHTSRLSDPPASRAPPPPESRASQTHDIRDSRPFYPNLTSGSGAPRPLSRAPSPGARRPADPPYDTPRDRSLSMNSTSYREPPPPSVSVIPPRGYPEDSRRPPLDANPPRRASDGFYPPPQSPVPPVIERREEIRQWREREGYPPASYSSADGDRDRPRRYPDARDWHSDVYGRDRDPRSADVDVHPRGRPPPAPPASWDRDRPSLEARDKDKERDGYEGWGGPERKYAGSGAPPSRWEDAAPHSHTHPHRPLHTRLTDNYDDRFVPRDVAERARYPPLPNEDVVMRDNYRDNPRVRQRSPSPTRRPGVFDDTHRAPKRARDEYEPPPRPPYFDDARRGPPAEYPPRALSPPSYYDPRAPGLVNPRDPSPYNRDRAPEPYPPRRDMPPPRSPPYYARERFPPR